MKPTSGESAAAMDFVNSNIWLYAIVIHREAFKSEAALGPSRAAS
jgi:hypothetical protein